MKPFVTISASYGAGGSEVAPVLAARLGVPFFDRALAAQVAERLGTTPDDPLLQEERPAGLLARLLPRFSTGALYAAAAFPPELPSVPTEEEYRAELDRVIRGAGASAAGGVLLGRAGAVVLAEHPTALHVRLDGPPERRIERVHQEAGLDHKRAAARLRENDRAREAYVKQLYQVDATNPRLYHLIIDSTAIPLATCVELIARAAQARRDPSTAPAVTA